MAFLQRGIKGDANLFILPKETSQGKTFTYVKRLNDKERVKEVVRMLPGVKITGLF